MASTLERIFRDKRRGLDKRVLAGDALRYELVKETPVPVRTCGEEPAKAETLAAEIITLGTQALRIGFDKEVYDALERAYVTRALNDLHSYLIALEWHRAAKDRFYQPRMSVLREAIDSITDMMVNDRYDIVLWSEPPRTGKTTGGLFATSWLIGRRPADPILMTGYAEKITKMFYAGLNEIYEDPEYAYHEIFPQLNLVNSSANDLTLDFRSDGKSATRKYKSVTCRAIDGSLTGATEARQLLYCDDLVRDIEEALNPNRLTMLRDKMVTNVYSRKKEGCKELHIGTRWSVHDPLGWVETQNADNPRCKVIRIPALDPESDESNFDYPYGVGFSTEYYHDLRKREDDVTWQCVYQQQPIEREGLLFPMEDLRFTYAIPPGEPDDIFAFGDVAFGGGDYLSVPIAAQWGDDAPIIIDWVFNNSHYKVTEPIVAGRLIARNVRRALFEANNGGEFYANDIDKLLKEQGYKIHLVSQRAPSNKSKETRIIQHSPAIRDFVFLHPTAKDENDRPLAPAEYRLAIQHLTTYTQSGKNMHDDAPDSLAGLAAMMRTNLNATATVYDRRHI
jgi:predicted phage terminase large subunit-like protein